MKRFALFAAVACLAFAAGAAQAASSAAIGTCKQYSSSLLDALVTKNFKQAGAHLDANLGKKLDPKTMTRMWGLLTDKVGAYESRGAPAASMHKGMSVVTTPMNFKKMALQARVACNSGGKIAGLRFMPAHSAGKTAK